MKNERMLYRRYKTSYADCQTVPGTYDKATKTIVVIIPEGRMKNPECVDNDIITITLVE